MRQRAQDEQSDQEEEDKFHVFIVPAARGPTAQLYEFHGIETMSGMIRIATMFVILIIGLIAGPAVSLYGSPTVSPVTAAACASEPLPPYSPSSISFFALSHAPPPEVIAMARKMPVTIVPISRPPSKRGSMIPATIGNTIGIALGSIIFLIASPVTMSTVRPYSGRAVPSMIPGISRNWRRTSSTTWPPTRPTACIAREAKRNGMRPPMKRPAITHGSLSSNETA